MTESEIIRVLETALLCAEKPMTSAELRKMFLAPEVSADDLRRHLAILQLDWKERGLELVQVASGWRFQSRPAMQVFLARLDLERPPKYSRAVLETLAIIAWRQPVTRGDIEDIRGVGVSSQIMRSLEDRGWIEALGFRDAPGRPALWGTTRRFLDDLGLRSLEGLPAVEALDSLEALAQLAPAAQAPSPPAREPGDEEEARQSPAEAVHDDTEMPDQELAVVEDTMPDPAEELKNSGVND